MRTTIGLNQDAIALSSYFTPADLESPEPGPIGLPPDTCELLAECAEALKVGGLLFIYGAPRRLPAYAAFLDTLGSDKWRLEFKYWIAIQLSAVSRGEQAVQSSMLDVRRSTFVPAHVGLLLFHKTARAGRSRFPLEKVRVPHRYCSACGQNVRDWGGKKHLMNPNGAALSDVWTDLPMRPLTGHIMPEDVLERISAMSAGRLLHVIERKGVWECGETFNVQRSTLPATAGSRRMRDNSQQESWPASGRLAASHHVWECEGELPTSDLSLDRVVTADCIDLMESLLPKHEHCAFDLIFADPPYNLAKLYTSYTDVQAEKEYLAWCDRWLGLCARLLAPGGSMFVLNLPKWALHHARTLDGLLDFRRWIAWQALAEPRGKLLPAHYALLYYTKPGGAPVFNHCCRPDSPEYCLRASCMKKRKASGDDRKARLTDVWSDIHRIRHKRDRDYHPCQLPEKLLARVILLASNPGQVIFDPFCGAGTTAVAAKRLGRRFITTDVDPMYADITRRKLAV